MLYIALSCIRSRSWLGLWLPLSGLRTTCCVAVCEVLCSSSTQGNVVQAAHIHKGKQVAVVSVWCRYLAALLQTCTARVGSQSVSGCCLFAVLAHFHFAAQKCCCIRALRAHLQLPCVAASLLLPQCVVTAWPPCCDSSCTICLNISLLLP